MNSNTATRTHDMDAARAMLAEACELRPAKPEPLPKGSHTPRDWDGYKRLLLCSFQIDYVIIERFDSVRAKNAACRFLERMGVPHEVGPQDYHDQYSLVRPCIDVDRDGYEFVGPKPLHVEIHHHLNVALAFSDLDECGEKHPAYALQAIIEGKPWFEGDDYRRPYSSPRWERGKTLQEQPWMGPLEFAVTNMAYSRIAEIHEQVGRVEFLRALTRFTRLYYVQQVAFDALLEDPECPQDILRECATDPRRAGVVLEHPAAWEGIKALAARHVRR